MAQRREHAQRWVGALQAPEAPPLILINGPADPISGRHAAEGCAPHVSECLGSQCCYMLPDAYCQVAYGWAQHCQDCCLIPGAAIAWVHGYWAVLVLWGLRMVLQGPAE